MESIIIPETQATRSKIGEFVNSNGDLVEVKKFPEGYGGDPLLNDLKRRITGESAEPSA